MRFFQALPLLSLAAGLSVLTSCGGNQQAPTAQSSPSPLPVPAAPVSPAVPVPAGSATSASPAVSTAGIPALQTIISNTTAAVNAGDFARAKREFDQFENSWETIEDEIKQKAPATYDAIEADVDRVEDVLETSDKARALAAIQALNQQVDAAAKL